MIIGPDVLDLKQGVTKRRGRVGNCVTSYFAMSRVQIWARRPTVVTEVFHGFLQSL
jgi:hypothetical protein